MEKREAELKAAFRREMRLQLPRFLLLQYATAGAPDREVVGLGVTTRWEFKHATPQFDSDGFQELTCLRLAAAAHCRYVIWFEDGNGTSRRTMIVHPRHVKDKKGHARDMEAEATCVDFDMRWLVAQVRKAHRI